ncbi:alpha-hydroxy-acid oxidizing enzyme [Photobacterium aquimaris]|uniref:Alpha-hydroxy-acid oxidizing protein n=1 Tax=Photobacterium aquimaris TaxID=512643 RepID=A0A2T3INK0_9GAMM|nr:alpha-hydroxy acid oxidase [Photobacterium aquimaris]OBU16339.1 alpha-hydroxy-acid oxidizing enzyme [Photobacterium aquimaris]OBU22343.1 alpha-hydroxy-acid oxidizing enzyme [Photobacterium aquimaris]PSU29923.1 alpha-hydroxy-acid oxidizing protein [Photobacterium aquimaris]PSW02255.1 alpha-hydroxy-acid oxidizing protein [Photobacterium aquimaris]
MKDYFNTTYPSIELLRKKAKSRLPKFAFEYVDGGCNNEIGLRRNTDDIRKLELIPYYLRDYKDVSLKTTLFGETYDAPFGVSPVGLQGLIWPQAPEILAKAAFEHNVPFVLSTVSTASIETIAEITEGKMWFQLYHPVDDAITDDLLARCKAAGVKTLVLLSDVPTFAYRPKEIKNGLAMPPKMTAENMLQIMLSPEWALETLIKGQPEFKSLTKYMSGSMNMHHLALFMDKTFNGRLSEEKVRKLRDKWDGNLVLKGLSTVEDAKKAIEIGLDGIIVSNHGGRQLDAGPSTINKGIEILNACKGQTTIMMDSGIREGSDIACTLAAGMDFTFMGRSFMYSVGALGQNGGYHAMNMLKKQLQQVMEQVCCEKPQDLPNHLAQIKNLW